MNKLQKIFNPTLDDRIEFFQKLVKCHRELLGDCATCTHYHESTMPGFVTDYGYCGVDNPVFDEKVLSHYPIICLRYEEDTRCIKELNRLLKERDKNAQV